MKILRYLKKTEYGYRVVKPVFYYSKRYDKTVRVYFDLDSRFWIVHDFFVNDNGGTWQDGSYCTNWQASVVAFDILIYENRYIHAPLVFAGTLLWGYILRAYKRLSR